jgi:hypothetical protein
LTCALAVELNGAPPFVALNSNDIPPSSFASPSSRTSRAYDVSGHSDSTSRPLLSSDEVQPAAPRRRQQLRVVVVDDERLPPVRRHREAARECARRDRLDVRQRRGFRAEDRGVAGEQVALVGRADLELGRDRDRAFVSHAICLAA